MTGKSGQHFFSRCSHLEQQAQINNDISMIFMVENCLQKFNGSVLTDCQTTGAVVQKINHLGWKAVAGDVACWEPNLTFKSDVSDTVLSNNDQTLTQASVMKVGKSEAISAAPSPVHTEVFCINTLRQFMIVPGPFSNVCIIQFSPIALCIFQYS